MIKHQSLNIFSDQFEKVFETYIRVGISEQAQIVAEKILAAKKAVVALTMNSPTGTAQRNGMAGGYRADGESVNMQGKEYASLFL